MKHEAQCNNPQAEAEARAEKRSKRAAAARRARQFVAEEEQEKRQKMLWFRLAKIKKYAQEKNKKKALKYLRRLKAMIKTDGFYGDEPSESDSE